MLFFGKARTVFCKTFIFRGELSFFALVGYGRYYGNAGVFVGCNNGTITGCDVSDIRVHKLSFYGNIDVSTYNTITTSHVFGGFVGLNQPNGVLSNNHVKIEKFIITNGHADKVENNFTLGGFAGHTDSGSFITSCTADVTMDINSNVRTAWYSDIVGGFVGNHFGNFGNIENCYANCRITLQTNCYGTFLGGFDGQIEGKIKNCYATGNIELKSSINYCGGL